MTAAANDDNNTEDDRGSKTRSNNEILTFETTDSMRKIGIESFVLNRHDFEFTFTGGRRCCVLFSSKKVSLAVCANDIQKHLSKKIRNLDSKDFEAVIADIEDQLVKRRDEIFATSNSNGMNNSKNSSSIPAYNENIKKNLEKIKTLRQQIKESKGNQEQWHSRLVQKYEYLKNLTLKLLPELWLPLEFVISVKSILNIKGWTLPFMAVLLAPPSSMKTVALDMLIDYPNTFTTDEFTPGAFVSHNSSKTEEQLRKDDMLPKMVDNLCIFPELAPLFTAKDEDLQRNFGKILRILDGKGFQCDSGAQGHRGYSGEMMLAIVGAAVEIQYRVYRMFGNLGQKIYYLRLPRTEKTKEERKEAAKQKNDFKDKVRQIKEALFDYLTWFDVAPECSGTLAEIDTKSGLVKISWDVSKEDEKEPDTVIGHIVDLGELVAHLRGVVSTYDPQYNNYRKHNQQQPPSASTTSSTIHVDSSTTVSSDAITLKQPISLDFQNDIPIIEEASRAITHLKSVAMGHAISQGRNHLTLKDIPIVIKLVLSTAPIARVRVFDLLLEYNGELTTSDIVSELRISSHTAHRTMTELDALEIVDKTSIGTYNNAEFKIKLKDEFKWFLTEEFEKLREGFRPADYTKLKYRANITESSIEPNTQNVSAVDKTNSDISNKKEACDSHTPELFSPLEREPEQQISSDSFNKKSSHGPVLSKTPLHDIFNDKDQNKDENISLGGQENFNRVTQSHGHMQSSSLPEEEDEGLDDATKEEEDRVFQEILVIIKEANGFQVAVNSAIQTAYNRSEQVRNYFGDKLTQRENKRVKNLCLKIIRHSNIEVVKHKPQLVVKWTAEQTIQEPNAVNEGAAVA